jgi:hypothetical protein
MGECNQSARLTIKFSNTQGVKNLVEIFKMWQHLSVNYFFFLQSICKMASTCNERILLIMISPHWWRLQYYNVLKTLTPLDAARVWGALQLKTIGIQWEKRVCLQRINNNNNAWDLNIKKNSVWVITCKTIKGRKSALKLIGVFKL